MSITNRPFLELWSEHSEVSGPNPVTWCNDDFFSTPLDTLRGGDRGGQKGKRRI